ncbi:hypothetical protein [Vibrio coralliirubri]|uniref:hypothetical protein n=1 Tax=Vibrio coralliirubri TaxID=1516159 RepID=UPI00069C9BBB|nr:hypothetical protein [Vibrio coralliirubri]
MIENTIVSPFDVVVIVSCDSDDPQNGINTLNAYGGMRCYIKDKVDDRVAFGDKLKFFCVDDIEELWGHLISSAEQVQISLALASMIFDEIDIVCFFPDHVSIDASELKNVLIHT